MSTLNLAFSTLTIAILLGVTLALFYLGIVRWRSTIVSAAHGVLGAMGLGILAFSLKSPARGVAYGVESFGKYAAIAAALALVGGCVFVLLPELSRRGTNLLIGGHAILGIAAYVLLLAYIALG